MNSGCVNFNHSSIRTKGTQKLFLFLLKQNNYLFYLYLMYIYMRAFEFQQKKKLSEYKFKYENTGNMIFMSDFLCRLMRAVSLYIQLCLPNHFW